MTASRHILAQRGFGVVLQLPQHRSGNFGRRKGPIAKLQLDHRFAAFRDAKRKELQFLLTSATPRPINRFTE